MKGVVIPMKTSPLVALVAGSVMASSAYAQVVHQDYQALGGSSILMLPAPVKSECIAEKLGNYRTAHPDIGIDAIIENGKVTGFWIFQNKKNAYYPQMVGDIQSLPYCGSGKRLV